MNQSQIPFLGDDGFYHPTSENDIIALVQKAGAENLQIRCRGAAHSLSWAIYTDPLPGGPELPDEVSCEQAPAGPNLNLMFDKYYGLEWSKTADDEIEVEAGIHLGIDPNDPTHTSTLQNSLLWQILQKGYTLSDLGGISHQTISGFLMTGSSGGSLWYSIEENIIGISMIDGNGAVEWFTKDDENFGAMAPSLGLLGIVSKVRLKLTPNFNIYGQQITYPTDAMLCPIDLFGEGLPGKPSLEIFLKQTPYSRLLWWPQDGMERLVIWEAARGAAMPVFDPQPYLEFEDNSFMTNVEQMAAAILFTMLGNTKFGAVWQKLKPSFDDFNTVITQGWGNGFFAWLFAGIITFILKVVGFVLAFVLMLFPKFMENTLYPFILDKLQPLTKKGKGQLFMDYTYNSLPMDNNASDIMMDTEFTEIWIPLEYTARAMNLVNNIFNEGKTNATGYYSTEIYAGKKNSNWLSPAYMRDVIRIDFFWFRNNEGNPGNEGGFFSQYWDALEKEKIPFRLHWAKFLPEYDYAKWAAYFKSQYPRWDDFMALREKRDPKNIFLTDYWSRHLFGDNKAAMNKSTGANGKDR